MKADTAGKTGLAVKKEGSAAAGSAVAAAAAVVLSQQQQNDDKQDPGAVTAAEDIAQTHIRFPPFPFTPHSMFPDSGW